MLVNTRSVYYAATDVLILRFMIEVCWAPMLAAFSVPLDQSDDELVISHCLDGFRAAIHVTAVMSMKTHRDAFVTSLAKFTSLHSAADIKQKNIDAIKVCLFVSPLPVLEVTLYSHTGCFQLEPIQHITFLKSNSTQSQDFVSLKLQNYVIGRCHTLIHTFLFVCACTPVCMPACVQGFSSNLGTQAYWTIRH